MMLTLFFGTLILLAAEAQKPICLITAPNIIHLGVEETVTVQLHGATDEVHVNLYFQHIRGQVLSEKRRVRLDSSNQYQAIVTLKANLPEQRDLRKNFGDFLQLVAESNVFKHKKMANILVSTRKGYIFIQTDKPIYNPGEYVKYRVFTLDNYMLPVDELIQLQIFNSKGLQVYSHTIKSDQILERGITIPDVEMAGHWKITASFPNFAKSETSVEFEIREYVLPLFEVNIEASKPYHTVSHDIFSFSISARYTYGKGVSGVAYVRFGLINEQGERTYLPGIEKQVTVDDGHADLILFTTELQSAAANQSKDNIEGHYLYIAVTVLEKASGDLEEAESSSVKIVATPYSVDLAKTKIYFTPGGTFSILGTTTYPDGSRVPHLRTNATIIINPAGPASSSLTEESRGNDMGDIAISFPVPKEAKTMSITVSVEGGDEELIVSSANIISTAIIHVDGSYLSVEVQHQVLQPGQNLRVTLRDITTPGKTRPSHIYYMVVSKGRVLDVGRVQRTDLTSLSLPFSADMVPSFRLVAYYYNGDKIVADSVWVDVKDVCKERIEIAPFNELRPAEHFEVSVTTELDSKVALSAVDSAVYILNKKNKLSPQKMFEMMNSYDLACSVGGGEDSLSVLEMAGLTLICSCEEETHTPPDHKCYKESSRHKRDVEFSKLVNSFRHSARKCCEDGMKRGLMLHSCEERLKQTKHQPEDCRQAFKKCCEAATLRRKKDKLQGRKRMLGRTFSGIEEEEDLFQEDSIHLRSYFPQSWMWVLLKPNISGNVRYSTVAPDSITTWEVQAVGISPTKGFCVADPKPLRVFQDFFVSVKLPYSVKRNEQIEVKAVIYNYKQQDLEVKVKMRKAEGLCSAGEGDVVQDVSVPAKSAVAVYFTVVPLIIAKIPISIVAYASPSIRDMIQKELRVVGEGELVSIHTEHNIEAKRDKLEFEIPAPEDEVPGQDSTTLMSFKGGVMGESVDNCLNLKGVDNLIQLPTGCAEQTMVKMSPAINAIRYLDATHQWLSLKAERREEAQAMVLAGYNRVLTYKKDDGSYGAFLKTPSSNWLTAFIAKELTRARDIIAVRDQYIQEAMTYLMSKQKANGAWDDPNPLYDKGMKGGVGQEKDDASLTAYILLTMKYAKEVYEIGTDTELIMAMNKARSYLVQSIDGLGKLSPYAVAITAYALSLNEPQNSDSRRAHRVLMEAAKCDTKRCFWDVSGTVKDMDSKADAISIEATAYGLLQALTMQDKGKSIRITTWLTQQRKFGGGFRSTQDTVVALEALSEFSIQENDVEDLDLTVEMCLNGGKTQNMHLNMHNALTQKAVQVKDVGKVALNVRGRGKGTLSVLQIYRSLRKDESHCDLFDLSVIVEGELVLKTTDEEEQLDDYYNYETYESLERRDEPISHGDWFDLRSRRKRYAPEQPKKENTLVYTVCLGLKSANSSGMVVVDISLLSGLTPNIQDLEDNVKGTEKYIDHYDVHHNKVFLYFNKLTEERNCVRFRADQIIPVGLVQPAAAVIYDYYSPDRRCSVFYTAPKSSSMLSKLCEADVCTCAEGGCPQMKVTFSKNMKKYTRRGYACFSLVVNYAYKVKILNSSDDGVFTTYSTLITSVLQIGKDAMIQRGAYREMVQRATCVDVDLKNDAEYLIMGRDDSITEGKNKFKYILNNKMWIEEVPPEKKCKASRNRVACQDLKDFMDQHVLQQCSQ
ncbi:complement C4-B [Hoplias malabaricus]|uniref:complement C4-B n=1 Tax=Hoplias malabaricus TaxID=27720 RepID=UPI003461E01C